MTCDAFELLFLLIARWKELPFFFFGAVSDARDGSHTLSLGAPIPRQGCSQPVSHKICS